ncbi:restriction endonuclease subunit S [Lysobacter sp. F60174L2]|uniref:restriction endonuclease subunit S n=1 Tax=Lysobacter sp. F60174L2 TaxID=3459295 RepID=UPI00403E163B
MIDGLKPYVAYKDSGSKWLGEVPEGWEVRNLRTLVGKRTERNCPDLPLLSVAREKGVFVRSLTDSGENHNVIPDDLSNYKVARAGDLVINKMKAWQGSMGIAPCDGIVSPAYFVFDLRLANAAFGQRLLRSSPYVAHFAQASDGVRIGQWDLSVPGMREIPVLIPPTDEQAAIVRFLEHANRKIDGFIRAKRKLIALLNEQKQAIIHRAVTRGLDPGVALKPSGIEWLGDIPAHWDLRPFVRSVIEKADYRGATPEKVESGVFLVTAKNIRKGWIDYESSKEYVRKCDYAKIMRRGLPKVGDILLTTEAPLGHVALIDDESIALAQRIIRFRPDPGLLRSDFALYSMNSRYFQCQLAERGTGSTAVGIKASKLPQLRIALPPVSEQEQIVLRANSDCMPLESAIARAEREIALMQEYRTRLTTDIVTGKLDVRAAAATLPKVADAAADEPVTDEPADELEYEDA